MSKAFTREREDSEDVADAADAADAEAALAAPKLPAGAKNYITPAGFAADRKSTRLNSSHQ